MLNIIRYKLLMRALRAEIASVVNRKQNALPSEKPKTVFVGACNTIGSIV